MDRNSVLEQDVKHALKECLHIGTDVLWFDTLQSSIDYVKQHKDELMDGTVLVAEEQTKGRGRYQRKWHSPKGGVWVSYFLYNPDLGDNPGAISFAAAVGMYKALSKYLDCSIKWVNDLLYDGKKVGGVLTEGDQHYLAVGIGLNTNISDFDVVLDGNGVPDIMKGKNLKGIATSVQLATGEETDNVETIIALSSAFDEAYSLIKQGNFTTLLDAYRQNCCTFGKDVSVYKWNKHVFDGIVKDMDKRGCLIVEKPCGEAVRLLDEEVFYLN